MQTRNYVREFQTETGHLSKMASHFYLGGHCIFCCLRKIISQIWVGQRDAYLCGNISIGIRTSGHAIPTKKERSRVEMPGVWEFYSGQVTLRMSGVIRD